MAQQTDDSGREAKSTVLKRRGILAAAAAATAGIVAKQTAVPVAAATVTLGVSNTESATTTFYLPGPGTTAAVVGTADTGIGLQGTAYNIWGVYGNVPAASGASNTIGVFGLNQATGTGNVGVRGDCAPGTGVLGQSTAGIGVYGATVSGPYGVVGVSGTAPGGAGIIGIANGPNAVAFGTAVQGGATFAGYFNGTTVVNGAFAVTGSKNAAVKDAAGDYRLMYSEESPEAWFADYGTGTLVNGKADIKIDPLFAQHVRTDQYHVFLTEHDQNNALHVTNRTAGGFAVHADDETLKAKGKAAAAVNGTFSYRVVAKRNDIKGERLAKFTMPPKLVAPPVPLPAPPGKQP